MDLLKGVELMKADGSRSPGEEVFKDKKVIGLYFSAHWCPPCRLFTPVLKDFYESMQELGLELEIIFISSDRSEEQQLSYMKESHGEWYTLPHGSDIRKELSMKFEVQGIPMLIFLRADGTVADKDGRLAVQRDGPTKALFAKLAGE